MNQFSNILFITDSGDSDNDAFSHAVTLANNNQAQLTVIGIVEDPSIRIDDTLRNAMIDEQREYIQNLVETASSTNLKIDVKVLVGRAFSETICEVLRFQRDLVIKSVENSPSVGQLIFGGTDNKLLRQCPCPVWLINKTQQQGYRKILVALSYEPKNSENDALNRQLLEIAASLALTELAELHVVHAWQLAYEGLFRSHRMDTSDAEVDAMVDKEEKQRRNWLEALVNECCSIKGDKADDYLGPVIHLVKGRAGHILPKLAHNLGVEIVVMGTVGRTGVPGLLIGNTAEEILRYVNCSVIAIKPTDFVSPVTLEK